MGDRRHWETSEMIYDRKHGANLHTYAYVNTIKCMRYVIRVYKCCAHDT